MSTLVVVNRTPGSRVTVEIETKRDLHHPANQGPPANVTLLLWMKRYFLLLNHLIIRIFFMPLLFNGMFGTTFRFLYNASLCESTKRSYFNERHKQLPDKRVKPWGSRRAKGINRQCGTPKTVVLKTGGLARYACLKFWDHSVINRQCGRQHIFDKATKSKWKNFTYSTYFTKNLFNKIGS